MAGTILVGLLLAAITIGGIWFYLYKQNESKNIPMIPIEEAMYVSDWNITKIYGPGTPQQAEIVDQFKSYGGDGLKFYSPVLYRMNGSSSDNPREGILLLGFDPKHPEMALQLKAHSQ
jgi:hypothetical protein